MKSNTSTIIKKELARFFGDRTLFFTTVIMPGLLIYLIYSLMGNGLADQFAADPDKQVTMFVDNMPASMEEGFAQLPMLRIDGPVDTANVFARLRDKEDSPIYVVFPENFDSLVEVCAASSTVRQAPNVGVYVNSACAESELAGQLVRNLLDGWESQRINLFDVNAPTPDNPEGRYDFASEEDVLGTILSKLIPMLLLMLLASGCMAVAPSSIAGEKERGTIATLLVTPMPRRQLALGKIISLSFIALLGGLSSFLGIILSLPKMLQMDNAGMPEITIPYGPADYASILTVILSTVLMMIALTSILSAWAKDVKSAGTMLTPFMLLMMLAGLAPMLMGGIPTTWVAYLIPFFNSVQCMAAIFAREAAIMPIMVTVATNLVYTALLVWILSKMFNSERVMFGK